MLDILFLALSIFLFWLACAYARRCDRI